ncbi:MAG: ribosomal-protein-alanine N-acetyltransferase [Betaproteobacteria bacterium]|jgi:[ribosomal protein S18]-alanine N-acetyltransferase|nr:ribosomal-protein-alanine N-acetyltransferase [Betaproteobacteria bacterium]NBU49774.1 ribosomal-protein-alanine N-acetyltransferase [Betaproteobacteria bacterium]NBX96033.1 ribosomal-protein-alanine N-acetyltransferase [Betaproteobacteria bacterium]
MTLETPVALELRPLQIVDLDELMAIEACSYPFPWSRGNFVDSLSSGYRAQGLWQRSGDAPAPDAALRMLVAYSWAMEGVEELHLLNLTVHPEHRRAGHARLLLNDLVRWAVPRALWWMWLEVRASNAAARRLYEAYGFEEAGLRRGYYPNVRSSREDAVLMRLDMRKAWERVHEPEPA